MVARLLGMMDANEKACILDRLTDEFEEIRLKAAHEAWMLLLTNVDSQEVADSLSLNLPSR